MQKIVVQIKFDFIRLPMGLNNANVIVVRFTHSTNSKSFAFLREIFGAGICFLHFSAKKLLLFKMKLHRHLCVFKPTLK